MRIKLAILEKDQSYLNRIVTVFNTKYADKFEIYSFTEQSIAMGALDSARIDVFVASDAFEIDVTALPKRCAFAYFVESADVDTVNEQRAICKFQKVDLIYKQILGIYSENAGSVSGLKNSDDSTKLIAFTSVGCGAGTSTMAAAASMYFARKQKKTLYLNLEKFGSADVFFSGEGQYDMSDIIFALKSKKTNLSLKLESCVKQDISGVYFYSQAKIALDMYELTAVDILKLLSELKMFGEYDYLIVDFSFGFEEEVLKLLHQMHSIVWVGDGTKISNLKIQRIFNALSALEQNMDSPLTNRILLMYNQISSKSGDTVDEKGLRTVGGAPRFEQASDRQIIEQLSKMAMFDGIIQGQVS